MINNSIKEIPEKREENKSTEPKKPNEFGGVYFSSHVKIYDPNTKEVFVQKRADE